MKQVELAREIAKHRWGNDLVGSVTQCIISTVINRIREGELSSYSIELDNCEFAEAVEKKLMEEGFRAYCMGDSVRVYGVFTTGEKK